MVITNKTNNTLDNNNMKRIKYISLLNNFLINNPELYTQELLPQCILEEVYYYQRVQQEII
jgi:hypothetical protein